jgi:hypothetical protein
MIPSHIDDAAPETTLVRSAHVDIPPATGNGGDPEG